MSPHFLEIGRFNRLKIVKQVDFGLYLDGQDDGEILLPTRYVPKSFAIGEILGVFIYHDSEDRLIATTETPRAMVGEFALLKVVAVTPVGAFLDWGLSKDLFLPFAEQTTPPRVGQEVAVYIYLDKSNRISASMKLEKHMDKSVGDFKEGQGVDLTIASRTDLGFSAIIGKRRVGLLFDNEIFQALQPGQEIRGFIKKLRNDGKIDLTLQRAGYKVANELGTKILGLLKQKKGFLELNDKTPAETIYRLFGVSKKKFKMALGGLYKKRLITIEKDGIRLV
ncbi:MAG: S1-like domain-containing RNA-binding protein [Pseudomonadota bacterium]